MREAFGAYLSYARDDELAPMSGPGGTIWRRRRGVVDALDTRIMGLTREFKGSVVFERFRAWGFPT